MDVYSDVCLLQGSGNSGSQQSLSHFTNNRPATPINRHGGQSTLLLPARRRNLSAFYTLKMTEAATRNVGILPYCNSLKCRCSNVDTSLGSWATCACASASRVQKRPMMSYLSINCLHTDTHTPAPAVQLLHLILPSWPRNPQNVHSDQHFFVTFLLSSLLFHPRNFLFSLSLSSFFPPSLLFVHP